MKIPKRTKYKKYHRLNKNLYKNASKSLFLTYGFFGLKSVEGGFITERQIESVRQTINKKIKNQGKLWIRCFANRPITAKPLEVRMGKGKGSVKRWVCAVYPGSLLYEINGVSKVKATKIFKIASKKLPVKTKLVEF